MKTFSTIHNQWVIHNHQQTYYRVPPHSKKTGCHATAVTSANSRARLARRAAAFGVCVANLAWAARRSRENTRLHLLTAALCQGAVQLPRRFFFKSSFI